MIVRGDGGEWRSAKASDGHGRPKDPRSVDDDDNANDDDYLEKLTVLGLSLPYEFPHGDGNHY